MHDFLRLVVNHLGARTADVKEQSFFGGKVVRCADEVQLRFFLAAYYINIQSCASFDFLDCLAAVRGIPQSARCEN